MSEISAVETHASCDEISNDWKHLEATCAISGYQTRRWVEPWLRTVAKARGVEPLLILARDSTASPVALFPLTVSAGGGLRIASYAGDRDSNINMPLVRRDMRLDAMAIRRVLAEGARQASLDAFTLLNQPVEWRGAPHALSALPGQASPSFLHATRLAASAETLLQERMNGDGRKRLRWRLRKLAELGPVSLQKAETPAQALAIIEAFRMQKKIRIDGMGAGAGFDVDLASAFLEAAALADEPGVELHALVTGERIASVYCGVVHDGRYHAMVNSYDTERDVARASPGEVCTTLLLQSLCERGVAEFDLGVGESGYKASWCERREALFDTFVGASAAGKAYCLAQSAKQRTKRYIKQSAWLWPLAQKVRARIGRAA
ncbi:MAG: GNAT family N-acetyltransferase [Beijerinckiaceae bacterium]|nr:GNAT family N-acetyltransferase [Beijerinckiaceae bacterium]